MILHFSQLASLKSPNNKWCTQLYPLQLIHDIDSSPLKIDKGSLLTGSVNYLIIIPVVSALMVDTVLNTESHAHYILLLLSFFTSSAYDPADYEHLPVSQEIKELFQYITRYILFFTICHLSLTFLHDSCIQLDSSYPLRLKLFNRSGSSLSDGVKMHQLKKR